MKNKGRAISIFLGIMIALVGVFSQGFFVQNSLVANASTAQNVSLSSLAGYSNNGNTYNYVYFGEYPQTRVLKQKAKVEGEANYGTYTSDSESVHATIKGYIKALNETYYKVYLPANPTSPYASFANASYVWTDDAGTTTQVQNFYPQEDYEDANVSFEARSGYYTLKVAVTAGTESYLAGSKFHTYNQTVAYYEKMGSSYTYVTSTGTTGSGYVVAPTTAISAGSGSRSNISNWLSDQDTTGTNSTYNKLEASKIYLFVVEPIKWKILANDGTNVTIIADTILDSANFVNWNTYQTEWAYSDVRGWLNGGTTTSFSNSASATTTYTRSYSGRTFLNKAFTTSQQNAIATTTITQDSSASYYAGAWHSYDSAAAAVSGR
ncbi:hypothetical protein EOM60_06205, partial [Candidatus Saccharibacteria bacterium]|nr:hypothetical protein [Candidatus Saccharibacteria bacterium]